MSRPLPKASPAQKPGRPSVNASKSKRAQDDEDLESVLGKTTPSNSQLNEISVAVDSAVHLMRSIENLEEAVAGYKKELREIIENRIPNIMVSAGSKNFETIEGVKVELKDIVSATLPPDDDENEARRKAAMAWLRKNGADSLIKVAIKAELNSKDKAALKVLLSEMKKLKVDYLAKESVNPISLSALMRKRIADAQPIPTDLMTIFSGKRAKITLPNKQEK